MDRESGLMRLVKMAMADLDRSVYIPVWAVPAEATPVSHSIADVMAKLAFQMGDPFAPPNQGAPQQGQQGAMTARGRLQQRRMGGQGAPVQGQPMQGATPGGWGQQPSTSPGGGGGWGQQPTQHGGGNYANRAGQFESWHGSQRQDLADKMSMGQISQQEFDSHMKQLEARKQRFQQNSAYANKAMGTPSAGGNTNTALGAPSTAGPGSVHYMPEGTQVKQKIPDWSDRVMANQASLHKAMSPAGLGWTNYVNPLAWGGSALAATGGAIRDSIWHPTKDVSTMRQSGAGNYVPNQDFEKHEQDRAAEAAKKQQNTSWQNGALVAQGSATRADNFIDTLVRAALAV